MRNHRKRPRQYGISALFAWIAFALACMTVLGYLSGRQNLISLHAHWQGMSPVTALCIAGLAVPLLRVGRRRRNTFLAIALVVISFTLYVLMSHALFHRDVVSTGFIEATGMAPSVMGSMSVATASCLMLLAVACMARQLRSMLLIELLSNATLLVSGSALLGYAYGITDLYSYYIFNTMAVNTALSLFLLSAANLLAEPNSRLGMAARARHPGGRRLRHMLLALTALPALLGWLLLRVRDVAMAGDSFAMALIVMCTGVPMFYLMLEYARTSELLNRARETQARSQQAQAQALQKEVAAKTAELAATHGREVAAMARIERAKRSEAVAQLTGSIAHNFNNLLMVIGGSAQLIRLQMQPENSLLRHVEKIIGTVSATAKLTEQLAAFSRTQRLDIEAVLIDDIVRKVIDEYRADIPPTITLEQHLTAGDAWILGDKAQLQLAVGHLLRNALDAMDNGGTLSISTYIVPADSPEGDDTVALRVADDGGGMSAEVMASATEPFFTTKRSSRHPGLGLAQVSAVVHQAGGTLHLSSAPGHGTQVDIGFSRLTQAAVPVVARPQASVTAASAADNRRLLLIDDDADVSAVIAELLRAMDYEVTVAHDGEAGLRTLETLQPALAIIDYLMPGMNGSEVARKARQHYPSLPILFISGYADSEAIAAIPHARLLHKPILPRELEEAVLDALAAQV